MELNDYQQKAMTTCMPTCENLSYMLLNLVGEVGDILWQLAGLCKVMGWDLEAVAQENLAKLAERAKNGTIAGNGDGVTKEERNA